MSTGLLKELHTKYIVKLHQGLTKDTFEYWVTEHLRVSASYWGLMALLVVDGVKTPELDWNEILVWIQSCQHPSGAFGGQVGHDPHLLYTLSAIQIYFQLDRFDELPNREGIVSWIASLQNPDGSFKGDSWGEIDTRFTYCAALALTLLGRKDAIDVPKAVSYIDSCKNFDAAYGCVPGAESHAGQTFCCVGSLALFDRLDLVDADELGWWLCERQGPGGGLNGRPEKLPDVCYSWWIISVLVIIGRLRWLDCEALKSFILSAQDDDRGGIADRPGDVADIFHTFFGLAGLSLLGYPGLHVVDPAYALGKAVLAKHGFTLPWFEQPE